jgi:hypothetical protein
MLCIAEKPIFNGTKAIFRRTLKSLRPYTEKPISKDTEKPTPYIAEKPIFNGTEKSIQR